MFSSGWGLRGWSPFQRGLQRYRNSSKRNTNCHSSSSSGVGNTSASSFLNNAVLKAGIISGSLSLAGDCVAQAFANRGVHDATYDPLRMSRMLTYGLFFYGPLQHYWYRALDRSFPGRTVGNFLCKVTANQVLLAPIVIGAVFAWNLGLQGRSKEWPDKMKNDFFPTMFAGWKFWIPAASINFIAVPLQQQVLYMSACGVVWTALLSSSSAKNVHRTEKFA